MIIKKLSTDQFAGIIDKEIEFTDGVNVVFGKNEAGKSTLVGLLSGMLFKDVRLKMNLKADKEFAEDFFPGKKADGKMSGNTINGTVVLSDGSSDYKIVKEWGDEPSCKINSQGVMSKGVEKVNERIQPILKYG
ncbi:MAG: AAA family ATPase [Oscillospiraceae bacterium]|nr:AAA family ATPase [Oscillospiraceae bacterium]